MFKMKLTASLMMMLLSACSTSPTSDFCLLYTKPQISSPELATAIVDNDRAFADAVNANKGTYQRLCK